MGKYVFLIVFAFANTVCFGQNIEIRNKSFEGKARAGTNSFRLDGWMDCGDDLFPGETPPDVHPVDNWGKREAPLHGNTFVGLVIREHNTWESITQLLSSPMKAGTCYEFSIAIKSSDTYLSGTARRKNTVQSFTYPTVLRIWGGNRKNQQIQLLGESQPVSKSPWQRYTFVFQPEQDLRYIILEAFYQVPVPNFSLYNGHILIDDASDLIAIPCPENASLYSTVEKIPQVEQAVAHVEKKKPKRTKPKKSSPKPSIKKQPKVAVNVPKEPVKKEYKILKELNKKGIKKGQVFKIDNLYYVADKYELSKESNTVLDELYNFLVVNKDVVIEICGHTNGQPPHHYCDKLSQQRAESVANYLTEKGIPSDQIRAKGYGKREPIASNRTAAGRAKNQRVEIKILDI